MGSKGSTCSSHATYEWIMFRLKSLRCDGNFSYIQYRSDPKITSYHRNDDNKFCSVTIILIGQSITYKRQAKKLFIYLLSILTIYWELNKHHQGFNLSPRFWSRYPAKNSDRYCLCRWPRYHCKDHYQCHSSPTSSEKCC